MNTLLIEFATSKSEEAFRAALRKINAVSARSDLLVSQAVFRWLQSHQGEMSKHDIHGLFSLKNKLKTYLKLSPDDRVIAFIEYICLSVLPSDYVVDSDVVPQSCRAEMSYTRYTVQMISERVRFQVFELLNEFPEELDLDVINAVTFLFADIGTEAEGQEVYNQIKNVPPHERAPLLLSAMPYFLQTFSTRKKLTVLGVLHQIPQDMRKQAIEFATMYLTEVKDDCLKAMLIFAIYQLTQGDRTPDTITKLVSLYTEIGNNSDLLCVVNYLFNNMPPGDRPHFIESLTENRGDNPKTKAEQYVLMLLQRYLNAGDSAIVRTMAEALFQGQNILQLHDSHPLFLAVVGALILTSDDLHPKNPFFLYKMLQEERSVTVVTTTKYEEVAGLKVALDPELFLKNALAHMVAFDQLPKDLPPQFLIARFIALKAKIVGLDPVKKEQVLKEIKESYAATFTYLFNNIVLDPFIQSLEMLSGEQLDVVPVDLAHYLAIVKYFYDHVDTQVEGKLLSSQEELLLIIATSIQYCPGGKKEGCALYYNNLPAAYKYSSHEKSEAPDVEKALEYIQSSVQEILGALFSGNNSFLKELTCETNEIQQLAHVSTFVKNRIGSRVGLMHQLTFDPHTESLYTPLIEKSLKETLDIFYKHATPSWLIQELKRVFNRDKTNIEGLISWFNTLVESKLGKAAATYETMWQHDEEYTTESFSLTDEGARRVLQAAGYLQLVG